MTSVPDLKITVRPAGPDWFRVDCARCGHVATMPSRILAKATANKHRDQEHPEDRLPEGVLT